MDGVTYHKLQHGASREIIAEDEYQDVRTAAVVTMTTVEPVHSSSNAKLIRRVQLLEHQVKDLSGQVAFLRDAEPGSRALRSARSLPNPRHLEYRNSDATTTSTDSTYASSTSDGQRAKDRDRESQQFAFLLQNLEHLTAQRLGETDDLMNYCATFKATADGIPEGILSREGRKEMFLDSLPRGVRQAVERRCKAEVKAGDFDGLFIVAAEIVRDVQGFGWRGGGGCWNEFRRESASQTDLRSWLRLKDEIEKAWDGHVRFLATNGRKVRIRRVGEEGGRRR